MSEHSVRITVDDPNDTTAPMSAVKEAPTPMPIVNRVQSRFERQIEELNHKIEGLISAIRELQDSELVRKTTEALNAKLSARSFWLQVLQMVGVVLMLGLGFVQWSIAQQIRNEAQAQVARLKNP